MTFQVIGARRLAALMRAERRRDLDTSWLLHGPEMDEGELEAPEHYRIAAE